MSIHPRNSGIPPSESVRVWAACVHQARRSAAFALADVLGIDMVELFRGLDMAAVLPITPSTEAALRCVPGGPR
jgi:hypothetical protein